MGKVAEFELAATTTVPGIEAMAAPPLTTFSVTEVSTKTLADITTLPVLLNGPTAEAGENVSKLGTFGFTVRLPDFVVPLAVPEIFTVVLLRTGLVATPKVADIAPFRTVTALGMDDSAAPPLTMAKLTVVSTPTGALKVTLPVLEAAPPTTEIGLNVTDAKLGALIVSFALLE